MSQTKTAPKPAKTLKEKSKPSVPSETPVKPTSESVDNSDFFAPGKMDAGINDFVKQMKQPREVIKAPEIAFGDDEEDGDQSSENVGGDVLDEVEDGTLSHFDYDEEHEKTAEFVLMTMDQGFSFIASLYSGENSDKYNKFSGKKRPSQYQLDVTAAMVKKYQAKLSLEWMFATVVLMAFAPTFADARKDRIKANKKRVLEEEARRVQSMQSNYKAL